MPLPALAVPEVQPWLPATFRERGVTAPFTCPALTGARVRLLERRVDVIVSHPGGARGVYVLGLSSLGEFCVPTLHDVHLAGRLAALPCLSPASVRAAALSVAAGGVAGRSAAAAAAAATAADQRRQGEFLINLRASLKTGGHTKPGGSGRHEALREAARHTGRTPEAVLADMSLLAGELARSSLDGPNCPHGPPHPGRGRLLLAALAAFVAEIKVWSDQRGVPPATTRLVAHTVAAANAMHAAGHLVLLAGSKNLADPAWLLGRWTESREGAVAVISQLDWLLDGWEHVCLLWQARGSDAERASTLAEIAWLLPPVPAEADAWFAGDPALLALLHACPFAAQGSGARDRESSRAVGLTARNERIRGLAG